MLTTLLPSQSTPIEDFLLLLPHAQGRLTNRLTSPDIQNAILATTALYRSKITLKSRRYYLKRPASPRLMLMQRSYQAACGLDWKEPM